MSLTKQMVIDYAKSIGVDLIGFAGKERFESVPDNENPFVIAPEAKTVIMIGKRINRGALRGIEEGTNFEDYPRFGITWLDMDYIAEGSYNIARFIEDNGKEAVPIAPVPKEAKGYGVSVREGAPAPDVVPDFNYAATACGLGTVGLNGLFLSKKFGPRQRFQMIITEAEFESDPLVTESVCDLCGACKNSCPLGAIEDETTEFDVAGLKVPVAKISTKLCSKCKNGTFPNPYLETAAPDRCAALCSRACLIHLEENGLIENVFHNKFRQRKTWAKDFAEKNVEPFEVK